MQGHDNRTKLPIMLIELSTLKYKLRVIPRTVTPRSSGTFPVNCIPLTSPSATTLPVPEISWPFLALELGFNQCISGLPVPKALGHGEDRPEPFLQNVFYRKNTSPSGFAVCGTAQPSLLSTCISRPKLRAWWIHGSAKSISEALLGSSGQDDIPGPDHHLT